MKKSTLFTLLVALILLGACNSKSYRIKGTVSDPNIADSTKVYLSKYNKKFIHLDSTYVIDGKFEIKGEVDSTQNAYLGFMKGKRLQNLANFILESGNITVDVDTNFRYKITGTEQNNILADFSAKEMELGKKASEVMKKYRVATTEKDSLSDVLVKIQEDFYAIAYDYSTKYVNTLAGTNILLNTNMGYSFDKKYAVLSKMTEETKSNPRVKAFVKQIEQEKKTAKGQPYTDVTLKDRAGKEVKLSDYVGKTDYLLVDFWASWCGPCIRSLPELKKFYNAHKGSKFDVVGISLDNKQEDWEKSIKKNEIVWHHMSDLKGWQSTAAEAYAIRAIPATILIDKNGTIVGKNIPLRKVEKLLEK